MKRFMIVSLVSVVMMSVTGCSATPYNTVKTGPDRYTVTGTDPNQLQGNAFMACRNDGFDDYAVVETTKNRLDVRCEKTPKSFFSTASESAERAWNSVKQTVDNYRRESAEKKEEPQVSK